MSTVVGSFTVHLPMKNINQEILGIFPKPDLSKEISLLASSKKQECNEGQLMQTMRTMTDSFLLNQTAIEKLLKKAGIMPKENGEKSLIFGLVNCNFLISYKYNLFSAEEMQKVCDKMNLMIKYYIHEVLSNCIMIQSRFELPKITTIVIDHSNSRNLVVMFEAILNSLSESLFNRKKCEVVGVTGGGQFTTSARKSNIKVIIDVDSITTYPSINGKIMASNEKSIWKTIIGMMSYAQREGINAKIVSSDGTIILDPLQISKGFPRYESNYRF
jgi:hypothetical protein